MPTKKVKLINFRRPLRESGKSPKEKDTEALGVWGEGIARTHLLGKKYKIVGTRVKVQRDEIDIIAIPPGETATLVFVEVKTRSSWLLGGPGAAIDKRKKRALVRAALRYLRQFNPGHVPAMRFDVIEVVGYLNMKEPMVRHTENWFNAKSETAFGLM